MNGYRLLACDIDGTLLRSDGTVSARTLGALRLAEKLGAVVALATGRRIASTTPIARRLNLNTPCIAHCGAVVYEPADESILMSKQIPKQAALEAYQIARSAGADVAVHESVHSGRSIYVATPRELEDVAVHWPFMLPHYQLAEDLEGVCRTDPVQLCVTADTDVITGLIRRWARQMPEALSTVDYGTMENGKHMVDVFAHGVDKALGVAFVADLHGIARSETIAFGDSGNDIEMILHAGLGVAMGNAPAEIRGIAHKTAPSNDEDGVAQVIEELAACGRLGRRARTERDANARLH